MNSVTRQYMKLLGRIQVNDRGNMGISWHAGNLPHASATHFYGNAAGNTVQLVLDTSNPNIDATQVSNAMVEHITNQSRVRLVRYIMYLSGSGAIYDGTAVGVTNINGVPGDMGDISPIFSGNQDISLQSFTDYYEKLYSRYTATYRNTATLLTDTICHSSCHTSCHYARGRR